MNSIRNRSADTNPPWPQLAARLGLNPRLIHLSRMESNGFSGTLLWRVRLPKSNGDLASCPGDRELIVRRLPPDSSSIRLEQIRAVLDSVFQAGCDYVPVPLASHDGRSVIELEGDRWQVEPAFSGHASYRSAPTESKLQQAMEALARWHLASESYCNASFGSAPGVVARMEMCQSIQPHSTTPTGQFAKLHEVKAKADIHPVGRFFIPFVESTADRRVQLSERLTKAAALPVPVQFCIRDIHHDHLLFSETDDRLTAIVDYDAVRLDCVAADLARLLRSLFATDPDAWHAAIHYYEAVRPLHQNELALLEAYDESNRLLSGIQWMAWIFLEGRQFDWARVEQRLNVLLTDLNAP